MPFILPMNYSQGFIWREISKNEQKFRYLLLILGNCTIINEVLNGNKCNEIKGF